MGKGKKGNGGNKSNEQFLKMKALDALLGANQQQQNKNKGGNKQQQQQQQQQQQKDQKKDNKPVPITEDGAKKMFVKMYNKQPNGEQLKGFMDILVQQRKRDENAKKKVAINPDQMRWEILDKLVDERTGMRIKTLLENAPMLVERSGRPPGRIVYFAYLKAHGLWVVGVEYPFSSAALFVNIRSPATVRIEEAFDVEGRFHDPSRGAIKFVRSKGHLQITELFSRPTHGDFEPVPAATTKLSPSGFEYVVQTSEMNDFLTRVNFHKLKYMGVMINTIVDNASSYFGAAVGKKGVFTTRSPPHKLVYVGFDGKAFVLGFDYMKQEDSCALYVSRSRVGGFAYNNGTLKEFKTSFFPDGYHAVQTKARLYDLYGEPFDVELSASVRDLAGIAHDRKPGFFDFHGKREFANWQKQVTFRAPAAPGAPVPYGAAHAPSAASVVHASFPPAAASYAPPPPVAVAPPRKNSLQHGQPPPAKTVYHSADSVLPSRAPRPQSSYYTSPDTFVPVPTSVSEHYEFIKKINKSSRPQNTAKE